MRLLWSCAFITLAILSTAGAAQVPATAAGPLRCESAPDVAALNDPVLLASLFPDYDETVLKTAEYAEYELPPAQHLALLTCQATRDCYIAAIHYAANGDCLLIQPGLPLPQNHQTTITGMLPASGGVTRLLLWSAAPPPGQLELMARQPAWTKDAVPTVLAQRWFPRAKTSQPLLPWVDPFLPTADSQGFRGTSMLPACRAAPTISGSVLAKDCAVECSSGSQIAFGTWGSQAQWELDWATNLELLFLVSDPGTFNDAQLVLILDEPSIFQSADQSQLELTVNGWPISGTESVTVQPVSGEPIVFRVSHYLVAGENKIRLRVNSLSDTPLLLRAIEIWLE